MPEYFRKGTIGFSFPVNLISSLLPNTTLTAEAVPVVDILYFVNEKAALDLILGFNLHHFDRVTNAVPPTTSTVTVFGIAVGAGYKMYKARGPVHAFVEPTVVVAWGDTANTASLGLRLGGRFGIEHTIGDWFTLSGAIGGAISFTDKFHDIQVIPTASLAANFYWK